MAKKVLVGCPVSDLKSYCLTEYLRGLKSLTYPNFDVLLVDNSKEMDYSRKIYRLGFPVAKIPYTDSIPLRVVRSRNLLRDYALKEGYDYFLCLEQDVIPPPNIIQLLLEPKADIVSGIAPHMLVQEGKNTEIVLIGVEDKERPGKFIFFSKESALKYKGVIEVDYAAMACLLMSKKVLKDLKFRFDRTPESKHDTDVEWDDVCFSKDAKEKGYKIHANLAAKCDHLYYNGFCATLGDTKNIQKTPKR